VSCAGFTDARSTTDSNAGLGKQRAEAVCSILTSGKDVTVSTVSHGEQKPSHSNKTAHGRALNRRAEITLKY
jgi:outer membrane protein OmpA-like peptidoglycan-associated protein